MADENHPWSEKVADVRAKGLLGKQLYVVLSTPTHGMGPVMENFHAHLAYQKKLQDEGAMFAAGPLADDDEQQWQGDGLVILRAGSVAEAHAIAEQDPMHQSGARRFRVRPWLLNEGSISLSITYSDQQCRID